MNKETENAFFPVPLEEPVREAVLACFEIQLTTCSGFLHKVNQAYTICFHPPLDKQIRKAAESCGLWVSTRTHIPTRKETLDVWLYGEKNPEKAKAVFNRFANMLCELKNAPL
jgi:hypothetical protein